MLILECYGKKFAIRGYRDGELLLAWATRNRLSAYFAESYDDGELFIIKETGIYFDLLFKERVLLGNQPIGVLLEFLLAKLHGMVSYFTPDFVFLRGDVVVTQESGAVVLVGPPISGKSHLSQALQDTGARRLSNYYAVVDKDGRVLGYPSQQISGQREKVGLIAIVPYGPRIHAQVDNLSPGQMALQLTRYIEGAEDSVAAALEPLAKLCSGSDRRILGHRGESEIFVGSLLTRAAST